MTTPTLLVTGARGAGKTTYIAGLLAQRPQSSPWALLVNDFGEANLEPHGAVDRREVAGCICCSAQVSLRSALVALLRARPERLLIEAASAAHPLAIVQLLKEPGIASAVSLEPTVCVVDPAQAIDARYVGLELYREQVRSADIVVLSKSGLHSERIRAAARDALASMGVMRVE